MCCHLAFSHTGDSTFDTIRARVCLLRAPTRIATGGTAVFAPVLSTKSRSQRSVILVTFSLTLRFSKPTAVYSLSRRVTCVEPPSWNERWPVLPRYDQPFHHCALHQVSLTIAVCASMRKLAARFQMDSRGRREITVLRRPRRSLSDLRQSCWTRVTSYGVRLPCCHVASSIVRS